MSRRKLSGLWYTMRTGVVFVTLSHRSFGEASFVGLTHISTSQTINFFPLISISYILVGTWGGYFRLVERAWYHTSWNFLFVCLYCSLTHIIQLMRKTQWNHFPDLNYCIYYTPIYNLEHGAPNSTWPESTVSASRLFYYPLELLALSSIHSFSMNLRFTISSSIIASLVPVFPQFSADSPLLLSTYLL